jgi:uncharacterized membrane protein
MRKKNIKALFQQKGMIKRAAALILVFTMILTLAPATARGTETDTGTGQETGTSVDGQNDSLTPSDGTDESGSAPQDDQGTAGSGTQNLTEGGVRRY